MHGTLSSPTHPANGDLSAPWLSLDVFGSPSDVIWMFLANLRPPKNIMEHLVSSETRSPKSRCFSTSATRGAHCFGAKQTAITSGAEISVQVPDFQARVPHICPTHGVFYKWGYPEIIHFKMIPIINHPFWGTPFDGNHHMTSLGVVEARPRLPRGTEPVLNGPGVLGSLWPKSSS